MIKRQYFFRAEKTGPRKEGEGLQVYAGIVTHVSILPCSDQVFDSLRQRIKIKEGSDVELVNFARV